MDGRSNTKVGRKERRTLKDKNAESIWKIRRTIKEREIKGEPKKTTHNTNSSLIV